MKLDLMEQRLDEPPSGCYDGGNRDMLQPSDLSRKKKKGEKK